MVANGHAEADGRSDQPPAGLAAPRSFPDGPRQQQDQQQRRQEQVEAVGVGTNGVAPRDGRDRHQGTGHEPDGRPAGDLDDRDRDQGTGAGHEDGRQEVGAERRVAEWLEDDGGQP